MQSKIELQRQKINAVRKLLRSAGPLCGTVALIAGQVIAPMLCGIYSGVVYASLVDCRGGCAKSLAGGPLYRGIRHYESGVLNSASDL